MPRLTDEKIWRDERNRSIFHMIEAFGHNDFSNGKILKWLRFEDFAVVLVKNYDVDKTWKEKIEKKLKEKLQKSYLMRSGSPIAMEMDIKQLINRYYYPQ